MKRDPDASSFDMLLDTMCNTFGGICFIALLIAIISAALPKEVSEEEHMQEMLTSEIVQQLKKTESELREAVRIQQETNARLVPTEALKPVDLKTTTDVQARLKEARELLRREIAKIERACDEVREATSDVQRDIVRIKETEPQPTSDSKKTRVMRMPNERVLENYFPHDIWIVNGVLYDLDNPQDVYEEEITEDGKEKVVFTRRQGGGTRITKAYLRSPKFRDLFTLPARQPGKQRNKPVVYLRIFTDDYSFRELCMVRDRVVELEKNYNWFINQEPRCIFNIGMPESKIQ